MLLRLRTIFQSYQNDVYILGELVSLAEAKRITLGLVPAVGIAFLASFKVERR